MFTKLLLTVAMSGFYWTFLIYGYVNATDTLAPALDSMWWGFIVMAVCGWLYTMKLIWGEDL